jgi:ribose-phosphate pyrophosphokinase
MPKGLLIFSGNSHPQLTDDICTHLGIPQAKIHLSKFSVGETQVEVGESVRGKDVFIVQSACSKPPNGHDHGGSLNDGLMELLITISACKTASAKRVTAVLPLFPYSRQSDLPYNKVGAPLARMPVKTADESGKYTFESRPGTPGPGGHNLQRDEKLEKKLSSMKLQGELRLPGSDKNEDGSRSDAVHTSNSAFNPTAPPEFKPQRGYKQWVAQAGTLVADLLTCAGADHIITMDLHDPQYQGFFDIPVDNLYGRHLLRQYIAQKILPQHGGVDRCVIVSPDAGGAKRATSIADSLGMEFALIHKVGKNPIQPHAVDYGADLLTKERRPRQHDAAHHTSNGAPNNSSSTLLLVGHVREKICILIDDLADTSNTITRAAKLLKREGATKVYALVTHGVLSGDAVERIFHSGLDKVSLMWLASEPVSRTTNRSLIVGPCDRQRAPGRPHPPHGRAVRAARQTRWKIGGVACGGRVCRGKS